MKHTKELRAGKAVTRAILATAVIVIGLALAGCGEQMARIEDQQLRLQAMVEANTEQIAAITARIEQNQEAFQAGLEDLRSTVRQVAAQTTSVGQEQLKMQETAKNSSLQMTAKIAALEQNQHELKAGIENVQNDARTRVDDLASDVTAVASEQARLSETVQNNSRQLADNAAMIEQDRQQWAGTLEGLQENIQQVTVRMSALGEDLSKLQQTLQQNVRELVAMTEAASREQVNFREKTQATLRTLNDSLNAVKQNQDKLQTQIKDVQNRAETIGRDVPDALAKFADQLARMGVRERAEIADAEASSSSPPAETKSEE